MSKREQKLKEARRKAKPAGPVTRRQQVAALRTMKANEVAQNVAGNIRDAVKAEVEQQLKPVMDTVMDCIDRILNLELKNEGDDTEGQERTETLEIPEDDQVVPGSIDEGPDSTTPRAT